MKKIIVFVIALSSTIFSCSSDSDSSSSNNTTPPESTFAMTAKINGVVFEANNPFGTNLYSTTNIWSYYPLADFVMLQGRKGGVLGVPEINLWLKKSDLVVGTQTIGLETFDTPPSHYIDLIDLVTDESEHTKNGSITITSVNTTTKIVKGTFQFTCISDIGNPSAPVNYNVTDGKFNYKYED